MKTEKIPLTLLHKAITATFEIDSPFANVLGFSPLDILVSFDSETETINYYDRESGEFIGSVSF